ncbi:MAG: Synechococcus phage Bellamy [Bacteroidota bacterium]|jgi:2-polyprenyl-3-methyl-5-hydroxy-6-metoxy-1,4-benzoquinol methylase
MNYPTINEVKNFWNSRPCNIKHSKKELGTIEYFNEVEKRKYFVEPHIPHFTNFSSWGNKKVLEIGCGIGTDSINFARAGAKITCLELSEKSLDICKKRFQVFQLYADFYLGSAEHLSSIVPVETYDLIYSFGVIHHTVNPEEIIKQIGDYMDKNSICKIMLYSKYSWKSFEFFIKHGYKFKFNLEKTIQYFAEAQLGCPVAFTYSKKEIKKLLSDYEIIEIKKDHIFPYIIEDYINYKYNKKTIFKILPKKIFRGLESLLGWHTLITFKKK